MENIEKHQELSIEDFAHENGQTFWYASEFVIALGYKDLKSGTNPISKARQAMLAVGIEPDNEIRRIEKDGIPDYKLSRFALYLVSMNASNKLPRVAQAQAYFASIAVQVQNSDELERIEIRDEITNRNKVLTSVAKKVGVFQFAFFHDAGYRGLYNRGSASLKEYRGISSNENILDLMNKTELAANLFRITQTEAKLMSTNVHNQKQAEEIHYDIGKQVREIYIQNTGIKPENSQLEKPIKVIRSQIKQTNKELSKIDKPKKLNK